MKTVRQVAILDIIEKQHIETQEELAEALRLRGIQVTQATVSRDIKELHLFKVKGTKKRFRYASITENEGGITDNMRLLFQSCVLHLRAVGNLIIIKTLNGNGGNAGNVIDKLEYREVVGTVAGVDTTLLVCDTPENAQIVLRRLEAIIKG